MGIFKPADSSLAKELEDGPLRRELYGETPAAAPEGEPKGEETRLVFTGTGSEYFRVWVTHLLLNLLTLGLYSPWAKVRKARWFAQHTRLLDAPFDFHADPKRILLGRLAIVALLIGFLGATLAAPLAGALVLGLVYLAAPLLLISAQRFRFANTSWRGLRFRLNAPTQEVYRASWPLLVLLLAGLALDQTEEARGLTLLTSFVASLVWPWTHAQFKGLQHGYAAYGNWRFDYRNDVRGFYGAYLGAAVFLLLGFLVVGVAVSVLGLVAGAWLPQFSSGASFVYGLCSALTVYVVFVPYIAAKLQQVVWQNTQCGEIVFRGELQAKKFIGLVAGQMLLTLLTCGLYWPFAVVRISRYRIESLVVISTERPLESIAASAGAASSASALGEGWVDAANLDLGW
ncbi:Inner membrane protein YjgN [Burkholderiales bacterium]|nr:Inner membrane protein YjgN [Burkholderiales bacterium]